MGSETWPLVILGGRDRRGTRLPDAGREMHPLRGYKGVDLRLGGRPLVEVVIERFRATGAVDPIFVAGPAAVYRDFGLDVELIDTDGGFSENLLAALRGVRETVPAGQIAFTVCDVLPEPADLERAFADLRAHQPLDFWVLLHRVDPTRKLGRSSWKPRYFFRPTGEDEVVPTLPGHLVVADPDVLRLDLFQHVVELSYRTRNRSISHRRKVMVRSTLPLLLRQDLRKLLRFERPDVTWTVLGDGLQIARLLKSGVCTQTQLERHVGRMWLKSEHRRRHPDRHPRFAILDVLSLARDIDTEEEAREIVG